MIWEVLSPEGRFAPLAEDHPGVGRECPGCGDPLHVGDRPALVNGIPYDSSEIEKALAGRVYNVEAQLAHESCAIAALGGIGDA